MSDVTAALPGALAPGDPEDEESLVGIALDLAPLLRPYARYRRLLLRIVQLPFRARFNKGNGNEDGSWSLTPDDLAGLELLLPEDVAPPIALAVRVVGIDRDENATIIGQFDLPLWVARAQEGGPPVPRARMERRVKAALRLAERRAERRAAAAQAELAAALEAAEARAAQAEQNAVQAEQNAAQAAEAAVEARVQAALDDAVSEAVRVAKQEAEAGAVARLEESHAGWREETARALEAERHQRAEAEATVQSLQTRLAMAEARRVETRQPRDDAEIEAEIEARVEARVSTAVEEAREAARCAFERDAETAHLKGAEAEAERQRLAARLAEAEARLAEAQAKLITAELQAESEGKAKTAAAVEAAVAEAVEGVAREAAAAAAVRLEDARAQWRQEAAAKQSRLEQALEAEREQRAHAETALEALQGRLEEAENAGKATRQEELQRRLAEQKEFLAQAWEEKLAVERSYREAAEVTAATAEQRLAAQSGELEAVRTRAAAAEAAARAKWDKEGEARISEAVSQAVLRSTAKHKAQLEEARRSWQESAREELAEAQARWRQEEARRFSAARAEWQKEVQVQAKRKRGVLRAVARRQHGISLPRPLKRIVLLGGVAAVAWMLYRQFGSDLDLSSLGALGDLDALGDFMSRAADWLGDAAAKLQALAGELWAYAKAQLAAALDALPEMPK